MVDTAHLTQTDLFRDLSDEILELASPWLALRDFRPGDTVFAQGEDADALYLIMTGTVRIFQNDSSGHSHLLATLEKGELFGERSFLTEEPRRGTVIAAGELQVAELSREDFQRLSGCCPELHASLCRLLARRLGQAEARHLDEEQENRETLTSLVGWQALPEFAHYPGVSPWAREINSRISRCAGSDCGVLILGPRGTGKDLVASLIHFRSGDHGRPVFHLDCSDPPPVLLEPVPSRSVRTDGSSLESAQESALFGHAPDRTRYALGTRRGYLELADGGDLILENVDFLSGRLQQLLRDYLLTGCFARQGEQARQKSRVRIIATSDADLPLLATDGRFDRQLCRLIGQETFLLKAFTERKKDIPAIARSFLPQLNRKHHKQVARLSREARNKLIDYSWPLNRMELHQVMDRAVSVCPEDTVSAEHIFLHVAPFSSSGKFNLLDLPPVDRIARHRLFPGILRALAAPLFLLLTLYALFGPARDNLANLLIWTLWWPALLVSVAVGARSWCCWCPIETLGRIGALRRRYFPVPSTVKKHGPWAAGFGFVAVLLYEQLAGTLSSPSSTGQLFSALLAGAAVTHLLFGPRIWCRYLCPLGRMVSQCARVALVDLHSNTNVCTGSCQVDDCIKEKSCPMGLHPTAVNNSDHCTLCMRCVKQCPHRSIRLDLRLPWLGVLTRQKRSFGDALFAVVLAAAPAALALTPRLTGLATAVTGSAWRPLEAGACLLLLVLYAAAVFAACNSGRSRRATATFTLIGHAYLPLACVGLFALYFRIFLEQGPQLPPLALQLFGLDRWIDGTGLIPDLALLGLLVPLFNLAGGFFSAFLIKRLGDSYTLDRQVMRRQRLLIALTTLAYLIWL